MFEAAKEIKVTKILSILMRCSPSLPLYWTILSILVPVIIIEMPLWSIHRISKQLKMRQTPRRILLCTTVNKRDAAEKEERNIKIVLTLLRLIVKEYSWLYLSNSFQDYHKDSFGRPYSVHRFESSTSKVSSVVFDSKNLVAQLPFNSER